MGIGAQMIVKNQTNSRINTTLSDVDCMYQNGDEGSNLQIFNNLALDPYKSSDWVCIQADKLFYHFKESSPCTSTQSHFQINYLNGSLGIDIGAVAFRTAVTRNTNAGQIQAVLAPNHPDGLVPSSFNFYLYGGPEVLAPLVKSVISANLGALTKAISQYLSQHPLEGGIVIDSVNFNSFSCPYAAAVPAGPNILDFSAILKMSGTASGTLLGQVLSVTDLILLIEGTIDLSSAKPKISITVFKCSLGNYDISLNVFLALVGFICVIWPPFLLFAPAFIALLKLAPTTNALAGVVNDGIADTNVNKMILDAINAKLGSF